MMKKLEILDFISKPFIIYHNFLSAYTIKINIKDDFLCFIQTACRQNIRYKDKLKLIS